MKFDYTPPVDFGGETGGDAMMIVASVKARDGLILATDSMSHIYGAAADVAPPT